MMGDTAEGSVYFRMLIVLTMGSLLLMQIAILVIITADEKEGKSSQALKKAKESGSGHISVSKEFFGRLKDGTPIDRYTIANGQGLEVKVITYGSIISSIRAPDRKGHVAEITLGFDDLKGYENYNVPYFGALVGRVANRISNGSFTLDNVTYQLTINDAQNHLHGGPRGWSKVVWEASVIDDGVIMTLTSCDGDEGYPGEVTTNVTYRLTQSNELIVRFQATVKRKATPINLTTHPYFNLAGDGTDDIYEQNITIFADRYLKSDDKLIPTGEIAMVTDTLLDLRRSTRLGSVLPLFNGSGYDHTFCVRGPTGKRLAARAYDPGSGRMLEVYTDQPGIQFYTGNFLDGKIAGRNGSRYGKHSGFCLETHNYPDAVNHVSFPDSILRVGSFYDHSAWYRFSAHQELENE